jgi:2-polyprenyl-3-methyl-5-hydroxy-6-metoxy-1,4-benzoquinol methylase
MIRIKNPSWHKCGLKNFKILFNYKTPPKSENKYEIIGKYKREFYECKICYHITGKLYFKIKKDIYQQDYFDATYKNLKGLSDRFNYITRLPVKNSDNKNRANRVYNFLNKKKFDLLDIGSGTGVFLHEMKKKGVNAEGQELDKRYASFCRMKKIKVIIKHAEIKKKYNLISFNKILEHVENPIYELKKYKRFLKKNGLIYVEVPDVSAKVKGKLSGEFCLEHFQVYSKQSLVNMAKSSNLTPLKIEQIIEPSGKHTLYGFFKVCSK